ncbi:MAG: VCBS repeat-containing protein, partial [Fuerstia sp.]|nr:VCBS repeat-containing protein [Fuerstiella sp.]
ERYADAFQVGVAALDADVADIADEQLTVAVNLIPDEPAGWANRGLLYLRTERLPEAAEDLERARLLAPDAAAIQKLLGMLARRQGRFSDSATHFRAAADRDSHDIRSLYLLGEVLEQENQEGVDTERLRLLNQMLEIQPANLKVLMDQLRLSLQNSDPAAVSDTMNRLRQQSAGWAEKTRQELDKLEKALSVSAGPESLLPVLQFSNLLLTEPAFRRSIAEVAPSDTLPGESLPGFLRLSPIQPSPAAADTKLTFTSEPVPVPEVPPGRCDVVKSIWMAGDQMPTIFVTDSKELRRLDDATALPALPVSPEGLISFDINNDSRTDLLLAGPKGLQFFQQQEDGQLIDRTSTLGLSDEFVSTAFASAFAADVDLDGDLDVLLSVTSGSPWFLRNNSDGTMSPLKIFASTRGPQSFAWADLDHDGAPDAALLDADGQLRVFANDRMAEFREWPVPLPDGRFRAIVVADANDDGVLDLVTLQDNGALVAISDQDNRNSWQISELGRWDADTSKRSGGFSVLRLADFDNNGVPDLLASDGDHSGIWLGAGGGKFLPLQADLPPRILSTLLTSEGRFDLLGLDADGHPFRLKNSGSRNYHWQTVRLRAAGGEGLGDNRINSYAIGGEIELKTGSHVVTRSIDAPVVHFGLGERS